MLEDDFERYMKIIPLWEFFILCDFIYRMEDFRKFVLDLCAESLSVEPDWIENKYGFEVDKADSPLLELGDNLILMPDKGAYLRPDFTFIMGNYKLVFVELEKYMNSRRQLLQAYNYIRVVFEAFTKNVGNITTDTLGKARFSRVFIFALDVSDRFIDITSYDVINGPPVILVNLRKCYRRLPHSTVTFIGFHFLETFDNIKDREIMKKNFIGISESLTRCIDKVYFYALLLHFGGEVLSDLLKSEEIRKMLPDIKSAIYEAEEETGIKWQQLLEPEDIRGIPSELISFLTPEQLKHLTPEQLKHLTPEQLKHLTPEQIRKLDPKLLNYLTKDQLGHLDKKILLEIIKTKIEKGEIKEEELKSLGAGNTEKE